MSYTQTSSKSDLPLYSSGPDGMLQTWWPVHGVDDMSEFSAGDREAWLAGSDSRRRTPQTAPARRGPARTPQTADAGTQQCDEKAEATSTPQTADAGAEQRDEKAEALSMLQTVGPAFYHTIREKRQGSKSRIPALTSKQKAVLTGFREVAVNLSTGTTTFVQCRACRQNIRGWKWQGHVSECWPCDAHGQSKINYRDSLFAKCLEIFHFQMLLDKNDALALVDKHYHPTPPSTKLWTDDTQVRQLQLQPLVTTFLNIYSPTNGTLEQWQKDLMDMIARQRVRGKIPPPFRLRNAKMTTCNRK